MEGVDKVQTASQLIREAALKTDTYEFKPGKIVEYKDSELQPVSDKLCWLCGGKIDGLGMPVSKAIKPTFTDHPYARGHGSTSLCSGCAFCLSYRELRNYSILATKDGINHPSRAEWRDLLLNPPEPPFVICLAVSGQKHLSFKGIVSQNKEFFDVLLEEQVVSIVPNLLSCCLQAIEHMYIYFTKDEIQTGNYSQNRIKEMGLDRWLEGEKQVSKWRKKRIFEIALFVAQKQKKPEVNPDEKTESRHDKRNTEPVQEMFKWV